MFEFSSSSVGFGMAMLFEAEVEIVWAFDGWFSGTNGSISMVSSVFWAIFLIHTFSLCFENEMEGISTDKNSHLWTFDTFFPKLITVNLIQTNSPDCF